MCVMIQFLNVSNKKFDIYVYLVLCCGRVAEGVNFMKFEKENVHMLEMV